VNTYDGPVSDAGTIERARGALRSLDFRRLFGIRLVSQFADGLFQASLIASIVFSPENQGTTVGLFKAALVVSLPYSILGPFVGVFIDRWSRRRILVLTPWIRTATVLLVLFDPAHQAVLFFAGALIVLSVNRFFLATAQAVVPRLVPGEDLLIANSMATVGGTVALLAGVYVGGQVADAFGSVGIVVASGGLWLVASLIGSRIGSDLAPHAIPEDPDLLRHEVRRVLAEFRDGIGRLARTPRAIGPITSITLDQIGQGVILTLSLVVFRDRFREGVGSFSNLLGAGGLGVLLGIVTVGALEDRFAKERIVAGASLAGGLILLAVSLYVTGASILLASFAVGITFAWKKIPVDTMVQESLPDGYRGRVFAVYDVAYNLSRLVAAAVAIPLIPLLGDAGTVAAIGLVFVAWAPVLPRWVGRVPSIDLRFTDGAEEPTSIAWGGVEEAVQVRRAWEQHGRRCFRLALADGSEIEVSGGPGRWRRDAETTG
jgi:predicted MFS family arabinose efflux permease